MQFSVETTEGLERRLSITVPADKVDSEVKNRIKQLAKTQRIDGFRPGKVPYTVIQKRYGQAVRDEVANQVMQSSFYEAIVEEKINPAGAPFMEVTTNEDGKDFEFAARFEVYPEFEIAGLSDITIEKPVVEIKDADIDNMMDTLRKQHATWSESDAAVEGENQVTIDFTGTVDGEEFEGGKAEDFKLVMGEGRMIPGFEDGILGKKAGETFDIDVTFPEDYHAENLKGKEAKFSITLKAVEKKDLPELNDEFATLFGVDEGGVDALRAEVTKNMQRELDQALKAKVKEQVLKGLVEANEFDLPRSAIDMEIDALRKQSLQRFGGQFDANNMPELPAELFEEQAKERVKVGLLLGEVIKVNELKVDDSKVVELIQNMASAYESPDEVVSYYQENEQMMQQMRSVALEEQAVEFVLEQSKVSDTEATFDEIMNPKAPQ